MRTTDAAAAIFYGQQARDCACGCGGGCLHTAIATAARDAALRALDARPASKAKDKSKK